MKTLQCDQCGTDIQGEDFQGWLEAAHPHWLTQHADVMEAMKGNPNAEQEKEKWMTEMKQKFEEAPEA